MTSLASYLTTSRGLRNSHSIHQKVPSASASIILANQSMNLLNFQIEKYNSTLNVWFPMTFIMENQTLYFFDRKNDKTPKEFFSLSKTRIKFFKNYKQGSMKKAHVISFAMDSSTRSRCVVEDDNYNFLISFKTEAAFIKAQSALMKQSGDIVNKKAQTRLKMGRNKSFNLIDMDDKENANVNNNGKTMLGNFKKSIPLPTAMSIRNVFNRTRTKSCFDFSKNKTIQSSMQISIPSSKPIIVKPTPQPESNSLVTLVSQILPSKSHTTTLTTSKTSSPSTALSKRKKTIDTLINMSLISENTSHIYPQNDINTSELNAVVTLGNETEDTSSVISSLVPLFDEYKVFIYDPYILKTFLKSHGLGIKHIGTIYQMVSSPNVKTVLLIQMIAIISRKFLQLSVVKSLEVVLREKELNESFTVTSSHPHSIEYCIVDLFNTFISVSEDNIYRYDLYAKILPNYIKEKFNVDINVSHKPLMEISNDKAMMSSLLYSMMYYNRVCFTNAESVDVTSLYPFTSNDIKYISPYYINKWHIKASETLSSMTFLTTPSSKSLSSNHIQFISTTNAKRIKSISLMNTVSSSAMLSHLKSSDESNDSNRICVANTIYNYILNKKNSLAVKLCDYYLSKFLDIPFLNAVIYMYLGEVYNDIKGFEFSKLLFDKARAISRSLYPGINSFEFEVEYNYLLVMMKQSDEFIEENLNEISETINQCEMISRKFYGKVHYKVGIQKCILDLGYKMRKDTDEKEIWEVYNKVREYINEMKEKGDKGEGVYWDLFIDLFGALDNTPKEIRSEMIQRMYRANKDN